ncbi:hypothetical protein IMZ48_38685 [Candidatus Bathyarchaeota archaeon]|nr:hypothetical protein [Candidatus Bathyarchaeota archaeon]
MAAARDAYAQRTLGENLMEKMNKVRAAILPRSGLPCPRKEPMRPSWENPKGTSCAVSSEDPLAGLRCARNHGATFLTS